MRKTIFFLPFFALALTLASCNKENTQTPVGVLSDEKNVSEPVTSRGDGFCDVTISADIPVTVCGLASNTTACQHCNGNNGLGFSAASVLHQFSFDNSSMVYFTISNPSNTEKATGLITTSNNVEYCFILEPGECRYLGIYQCTYFLSQVWDC